MTLPAWATSAITKAAAAISTVLAAAAFGYFAGHAAATDRLQAQLKRETDALMTEMVRQQAEANDLAAKYEEAKAQRVVVTRTITKEIEREVAKPVYGECAVPADGVRLLNEARRGQASGPRELDFPLP